MALLDDMKVLLRVSSDAFDSEIQMHIDYAKADMMRVGIDPDVVNSNHPLVRAAIGAYCKGHFGFDLDNDEAIRVCNSYRQIVADLMNSRANLSAGGNHG